MREAVPSVQQGQRNTVPAVDFRPFSHLKNLPPEPDWLLRGFLGPGLLTMLAGHPFAGKSMLVGSLLRALENGEPFLGQPTQQATAVLVAEEDESILQARARTLDLLELRSSYLSRSSGAIALEWPLLIERACEHALKAGHRLLIVDTFPGLAGLHGEEENDAGAIAERLRPLQLAAGHGLAVLFLHHMNAHGQPRGSKAFRGVVDMSIRFYRQGRGGEFRLATESRFPLATPATLRARLVKALDGWFYVRTDVEERTSQAQASEADTDALLWQALTDAGDGGLTYKEIGCMPALSIDKAKKRLPEWLGQVKVSRTGDGAKSDPYRWYART
jgi:hypothetical protein